MASKVTIKDENVRNPRTIKSANIPAGTIFRGVIGHYPDKLFVKVFFGPNSDSYRIYSLTQGFEWGSSWDPDVSVEKYEPVDVEIVVR